MGNVYNMVGGGGGIKLVSIAVTTPPTKTRYLSGESFDPAGMVVTATYSNGAKLAATGYAVEPSGPLLDGVTSVTIRYTEGGKSVTASQAVTVIPKLVSIAVTTPPTKTAYRYGEAFSTAGMVVKATYTDGSTAAVTGYTTSPSTFTSLGSQSVTVKYTENGVSAAVTTPVTVSRAVISTVPSQSGSLTYTGSSLSPNWNNYNSAQLTLGGTTSATNAGTYAATFTPTSNYEWSDGTTAAKSVNWTIGKAAGSLSISPTSLTLDSSNPTRTITVTRAGNGTISAESSNTSVATVSVSGTKVTVSGVNQKSGSAVITIKVSAGTNHNAPANKTCNVTAAFVRIYGVTWDGSSTTALTRTDDSALFADPVPAVGTGAGSSPFDNCLPWSGMTKVTDGNNTLVKIPKFWVKVTHSPFKVQIADQATDGFQVSPAHRDRGDGVGERDVVYIGRYECNSSYQSRTGQSPKVNTSLSSFRSGIKALGTGYYQADFALQLTLWYLYLVEFANWNGQTKIGRGNVDSGSVINTGGTDSMTYHTGRAAGTDGNVAIQYRNIENWWGNVLEWRDGIIFSDANICTYNNPANFADTYNGTGATVRSNTRATSGGWIKAWGHTKRIGYLMEKLCTRENALLAIEAVNEPRKKNKTAQWVESTKEARADELCELLRDFHPKKPRTFPRYDSTAGKWREINEPALWPDQYVHHMIVQVLAPVLMRGMDFYCCGSIPGRGPHRARKAIEKWLEKDQKGTKYAAELDIKKFYPSLSPREVMRFLRRKIKDEAFLGLIWRIIKDGIKIGFYISQWLANAVLEPLDHYIREKLGDGVRHYVRYIDNLTIFGHNKKKLHRAIRSIMEFLGRMGLRLKENWQLYNTRKRMVNAVGYRYKRGLTLIRKKNLLRLKRQCTRARKRIAAHRKIAPIQARGILSRSGQLKHCAGWSLYDKHVRPIEKTIKSVVREASRKERILCSST